MIEKGRHLNIAKPDKKRPFCLNVEDEAHFLLHCRTFSVLRENLVDNTVVQTSNEEINRNGDRTMFGYLLGNTQISPIVAKHLRKSMELRDSLIENPKQLN